MKKLLVFLLASIAYGQTAQYPGAVVTDSQLMVAKNLLTAKLVTPLSPTATSLVVDSNVGFTANMLVTVDVEIIKISGIVGSNVLTVDALGRGFDGSTAIAHPIGKQVSVFLDAWHHMAVSRELQATQQTLGKNMENLPGSPAGPVVPILKGGTGASTAPNALTALGVVYPVPVGQGGTGVGLAQGSGGKVQLSAGSTVTNDCVKYDASGNTVDAGLPCNTQPAASAQLQTLRIKPNTGNISTTEFADPAIVNVKDYNYPAQTPGGTLTAAVGASVTVTPCPLGVLGTDTRLRFWIANGTGTAESVASTGAGTCTSGGTTGTVTFTPANTHTGAWTISSSHQGIYEAVAANPFHEVRIPAGAYTMHDCLSFDPTKALTLTGDGYDPAGTYGTNLSFGLVTSGCDAISVSSPVGWPISPITLRGFLVVGGGAQTPLQNGIRIQNVTRVLIDNMMVSGFSANGIYTQDSFEISITNRCHIQYNGQWGVKIAGTSNMLKITDAYFSRNSRANGFGNLYIQGAATAFLQNNGIEAAGQAPFTTVTTAFGLFIDHDTSAVTMIGNYVEGNVGGPQQVLYGGTVTSLTEIGNWISNAGTLGSGISYDSQMKAVRSYGNTFYGATARRDLNTTDFSTYVIGPDTCMAGATECTTHPQMSGLPTLASFTFATLPVKPNGTQLYCSDCNATCSAGASTGRTCFREAGIWIR